MFEYEKREDRAEEVSSYESWSANINGYRVLAHRTNSPMDGVFRLSIAPESFHGGRIGILDMNPRFLSELEAFAEIAPDLLRTIAQELRAKLGTDDVRPKYDRERDEFMAEMQKKYAPRLGEEP